MYKIKIASKGEQCVNYTSVVIYVLIGRVSTNLVNNLDLDERTLQRTLERRASDCFY